MADFVVGFPVQVDSLKFWTACSTGRGHHEYRKNHRSHGELKKGFEDALKQGIAKAAESLENITGAWVMDQSVKVNKGKLVEYTVRMKLTFILK